MGAYYDFITWYYNEFRFDNLYQAMWQTVEGSPHHQEANVGVHTDMVVGQYLNISESIEGSYQLLNGAFAAAFHDVGKPDAMQWNWKEERGWYKKFAGHEKLSARIWEDWAVRNFSMLNQRFNLTSDDLYFIGWMIENHLPYGVTHQDKFDGLVRTTLYYSGIDPDGVEAFTNLLLADIYGRISADADQPDGKINRVEEWVDTFKTRAQFVTSRFVNHSKPTAKILIGPSGAGKSTAVQQIMDDGDQYHSMDDLRMRWYGGTYHEAFERANEDNQFDSKVKQHYIDLLRNNQSVVVDNTNGSRKSRRFHVQEARQRGYNVVMYYVPVSLEQLHYRRDSRTDKPIPYTVPYRQFWVVSYPWYDEADDVVVLTHNLEE